jgi:microcystin-dependent protein
VAIDAYPFDDQDTSESQYSRLFRELQDSGVADSHGGAGFAVTATSGMNVQVGAGTAIVRGHAIYMDASMSLALPAAEAATMYHWVVLRLDPAANDIEVVVLPGLAGEGVPALEQTESGAYDFPLALITVAPGTANITSPMISDRRSFVGGRVGIWSTTTREIGPRRARLGYNTSTSVWEWYDGFEWKDLVSRSQTGTVIMFAGTTPPTDAVLCNGAEYPIAQYPALAEQLGQTYGGSAINGTFRVPDLRDRFPVGANSKALGGNEGLGAGSPRDAQHKHRHRHSIPSQTMSLATNTPRGGSFNRLAGPETHDHGGWTGYDEQGYHPHLALNFYIYT